MSAKSMPTTHLRHHTTKMLRQESFDAYQGNISKFRDSKVARQLITSCGEYNNEPAHHHHRMMSSSHSSSLFKQLKSQQHNFRDKLTKSSTFKDMTPEERYAFDALKYKRVQEEFPGLDNPISREQAEVQY